MNGQNEENLRELFEKFVGSERAEEAMEDIRRGEQILGEHPAPGPSVEMIADIKAEIADALVRRKASIFKRTAYRAAVAAAAVVLLSVVSVKLLEKGRGIPERHIRASIIPTGIWESEDVTVDDADLATLIAETEQIEGELRALQLGEDGGNGNRELVELEMRLIELDSDFWKG